MAYTAVRGELLLKFFHFLSQNKRGPVDNPFRRGLQLLEDRPMDKAKKEALQELLRLLADNPDLADRITITIKPNSKPQQGERQET